MKWVVATGDEQSARLEEFHPESQVQVSMSPKKFLELCGTVWTGNAREHINRNKVEAMKVRINEGLPLDRVFLDVRVDDLKVVGQEGRHRAVAAEELGLEEIPVILFGRAKEGWFVDYESHPGFEASLGSKFGEMGRGGIEG